MPYFDSNVINSVMELMFENKDFQDEPELGPFWYDVNKQECFGVHSTPAIDCPWYESKQFGKKVKTGRALHQSIWKKETLRKKDIRFKGDYKLVPCGRVFQFEDGTFIVYTGKWIEKYPEAKEVILQEFQLPKNSIFLQDTHWDIGHGFSQDF